MAFPSDISFPRQKDCCLDDDEYMLSETVLSANGSPGNPENSSVSTMRPERPGPHRGDSRNRASPAPESRPKRWLRRPAGAPGRRTHSGPGGKDVVNHQDVLRPDLCGIGNLERPAHVDAALTRALTGLACRGAHPEHCARREFQPPRGMTSAQGPQRMSCEHPGLIKPALRIFGTVQGNRNHHHFGRGHAGELADRDSEHRPERASRTEQAVVFECMDGIPHAAFVWPTGHGANKRGRGQSAYTASRGRNCRLRDGQGVAASEADGVRL